MLPGPIRELSRLADRGSSPSICGARHLRPRRSCSGESRRITSGLHHHLLYCWSNIENLYGLGSCASIAPTRRTARRGTRCARGSDPIFHCLYKLAASGKNSGARPAVGRRTSPESAPAPSPVPANRGGIASAVGSILPCPRAYPTPPCEPTNSVQAPEG